jgi:hypothetical protein
LLAQDVDADDWSLPYWVPALVRRIKIDGELREKMLTALETATSVSSKLTLAGLLARATGPSEELKRYATDQLRNLRSDPIPAIGFDLSSQTHRPLFQLLTELAA